MIGAVFAVWLGTSVVASLTLGAWLHRRTETYPVFDPRPVDLVYGGIMTKPYPLDRAALQRILDLFDPAAMVAGDVTPDGYAEIVFPEEADAWRFVGVARDGRYESPAFAADVAVVGRVMLGEESGPVTLGVTLLPAWRPEAVTA